MPSEQEKVPFGRKVRRFLRVQRLALSIIVLVAGSFLTILAIGDFTPLSQYPPFKNINMITDQSGSGGVNYNLVFVIVGPITAIIGAYLVIANYLARQKFEHLMQTKSKAEFLRNIPDLEDTHWELTPEDEIRYEKKKAELRIRR
jgi:hypothetical protein